MPAAAATSAGTSHRPPRRRRRPRGRAAAAVAAVALLAVPVLAGCTGTTTVGSTGTVTLTTARSGAPSGAVPATTPTPVTPDGMLTGVGVTDSAITLGVLADRDLDRGFTAGVRLWRSSVNASGGICGRTIELATADPERGALTGYRSLAPQVLGMLALPAAGDRSALDAAAAADGMPVLEAGGSSAALTTRGPVVLGATEDITAINALAYLASTGVLVDGTVLGVLADTTSDAADALAGVRWWAGRNGVRLDVRAGLRASTTGWSGAAAVLALTTPDRVGAVLAATTAPTPVVTTLDGYRPASVPATDQDRLLIGLQTPAFGSDQPAAAAVARAYAAAGGTAPGPRLLSGYAVAAGWGRLLDEACTARALTRQGVTTAMTTVGPAPVDSLFGPSDPGLVVRSALPATRVSSMAQADLSAQAGLRPLIWSQAAAGIGDYVPPR
ncbi:ABC transporter substrate-binding protein [Nakamurella endophytica]|uniref:Branched-chain amino acid ABC transporter substrate-binding protein n=1 Tax=Nakamurella endophytica TaxID=1748367 RepID=A0A917WI66_9ACTN|nr:ABC transporter substrate-binding protein [Nakamurella endophytica]GGM05867.1 branched-chain amino acid ABC transporter substrate-binding protein [Nakamurella endophytica]